jgi:hypothetical protein
MQYSQNTPNSTLRYVHTPIKGRSLQSHEGFQQFPISGVPNPVTGSQPSTHSKPSVPALGLLPVTISFIAPGFAYNTGWDLGGAHGGNVGISCRGGDLESAVPADAAVAGGE